MDQKQIQIVLSVAKNLSFTEAAWDTSYAASVVSKQVASLEKELDVRIFDRKAKSKVRLTEVGEQLIPHLQTMQDEYNKVKEIASAGVEKNIITLICPRGFSTLGEDELISLFSMKYPNLELRQLEGSSDDCREMLLKGEADISIRMLLDSQLEEIKNAKKIGCIELAQNQVGVIIRKDHPAICGSGVDLRKLSEETFLFRSFDEKSEKDPKTELFREACRSEGFEPKIQFQKGMRRSAAFAMAAKGVCVIPSMHTPGVLYPGTVFLRFTKNYYSFTSVMLYLKSNHSNAVKQFTRFAKENREIFQG